jgi:hypothetical protein
MLSRRANVLQRWVISLKATGLGQGGVIYFIRNAMTEIGTSALHCSPARSAHFVKIALNSGVEQDIQLQPVFDRCSSVGKGK